MGVVLDQATNESDTQVFISISYNIATTYNVSFGPLYLANGTIISFPSVTAQDIRSNGTSFHIILENKQYRFVDWVAANDDVSAYSRSFFSFFFLNFYSPDCPCYSQPVLCGFK